MFKRNLSVLAQVALLGSSVFAMDSGSCPFSKADVLRGFYGDPFVQNDLDSVLSRGTVTFAGTKFAIKANIPPMGHPMSKFPALNDFRSSAFSDKFIGHIKYDDESTLDFFTVKCSGTGKERILTFTLQPYHKNKYDAMIGKGKSNDMALRAGWPELTYTFTLTGTWPGQSNSNSGYSSYQQQKAQEEAQRKFAEAEKLRKAQEQARKDQEEAQRRKFAEEEQLRKAQEQAQREWQEQQDWARKQEEADRRYQQQRDKEAQEEAQRKQQQSSSSSSDTRYGSSYGSSQSGQQSGGTGYGSYKPDQTPPSDSYQAPKEDELYIGKERKGKTGRIEKWNGTRWI